MKKLFVIILVVFIAIFAISLVACDKKDSVNKSTDNGSSIDAALVKVVDNKVDSDAKILKKNGYNVYSEYAKTAVKAYASSIGAVDSDLVCVTTATKLKSSDTINIYYFKTEAEAKSCYDAFWAEDSNYHIKDARIFYDNTQGNIFKYDDIVEE